MRAELAHQPAFAIEPAPFGLAELDIEHLDGDLATVVGIVGPIDRTESSSADELRVAIRPDVALFPRHVDLPRGHDSKRARAVCRE